MGAPPLLQPEFGKRPPPRRPRDPRPSASGRSRCPHDTGTAAMTPPTTEIPNPLENSTSDARRGGRLQSGGRPRMPSRVLAVAQSSCAALKPSASSSGGGGHWRDRMSSPIMASASASSSGVQREPV